MCEFPAEIEDVVENLVDEWMMQIDSVAGYLSSSSSSEDDDEGYRKRVRIKNFAEETVPSYSNVEFKGHFRLSREITCDLISRFETTDFLPVHENGREKVSHTKALFLTLWYLANLETFRQCSDRFDISFSSAHRVLVRTLKFINSLSEEYIKWPNQESADKIRASFKRKSKIDGIIGAIDGSHIEIKRPQEDEEAYVNRKGYHSINIQAIVDHNKSFLDVYIGEPGSLHDARILRRSPIYHKANESLEFFHGNFLLGDSAYPNLPWLVPPFKNNGNLSEDQKLFNYRHSSARIVVEHGFGFLKNLFRRLLRFDNLKIEIIINCIMAACVLHNICIADTLCNVDDNDLNEDCEGLSENNLPRDVIIDRRAAVFNNMFNN